MGARRALPAGESCETLILHLKNPLLAPPAAREAMILLQTQHQTTMRCIAAFDGLSQDDTLTAVRRLLMTDYAGPASAEDLRTLRNEIKDALVSFGASVIEGTVSFARALHGKLPLAIVTQTKEEDMRNQARALGIPLDLFDALECAGDQPTAQGVDGKTLAYQRACRRLGCHPNASIAIEDADGGAAAARAAGLLVLGLRENRNRQSLRQARLIVPDLSRLATAASVEALAANDVDDVFRMLPRHLASITVASSLGGTSLSTAEVSHGGGIGRPLECAWAATLSGDPAKSSSA